MNMRNYSMKFTFDIIMSFSFIWKYIRVILVVISFTHISSCRSKLPADKHLTIIVQPFEDIQDEEVNYVFTELKKVYPYIILKNKITLPPSAFYPPRNRYRADSLIAFLDRNTKGDTVIIGLTGSDISTTKNGQKDWGVMGLGFQPGKACVASDYRLDKRKRFEQLFKVAIHELGHTQGLAHCSEKFCFMRDAEGHNPTDEETSFCAKCKAVLAKKGWK